MTDSKRSELISKAQVIVRDSHIPSGDKELLEGRIPYIAESMLEMFVSVCDEDPFSVDAIVKSLKAKIDAQGNLQRLHEIVKQERREVEERLAMV
jgi:hypothetical protein